MALRHALIAALVLLAWLCDAAGQPLSAPRERVQAAFLYKFAAYVEWPAHGQPASETHFVIGVAGSDSLAKELEDAVTGRKVNGRPVQVRRLKSDERADACCHILFIAAASERARVRELLAQADGHPVLTVTESADSPKGSVINFLTSDDRLRFDISRDAAERNGLQLGSQLLRVARQVSSP